MAINLNHIDNSILIGTSEKVRITSAGKVGIGTAIPASILHLRTSANHNLEFEEASGDLRISALNDARSANEVLQFAASEFNFLTGNVGINQTNPTEKLDVNGTIQCLNELRSTTGNDLLLNAGSVNRDVKIQVNDVNMMYVQGSTAKVGVGIDSPDSKLHIHNGSAGSIAASSAANLTIESSASDYNVLQFLSPSSAAQQIRFGDVSDNGAGWIQYNHNGNALSFGTAGPEKMRLDSDGRLRIGNTTQNQYTAADDLIVGTGGGNRGITIYSGSADAGVIAFSDGTSDTAYRSGQIIYDHNDDAMDFRTNGNYIRLTIDSSGRVAFGGLTPSNYYSTYDDFVWGATSGSVGMTIVSGSDSSGYITWADGTSSADQYRGRIFYSHGDNSFNFRCNGLSNNIFRLDSSTATVTGTTDGVLNLDTSHASGAFIRFKQGGTTKNWIGCATGIGGYGDKDDLTLLATDNIIFGANSAQRMRLTGSGQLLVGTTSSSDQFHLLKSHNGHTRMVIQNNWGSNATAQLKLISPTDEFQIVKYAAGAAALNLSNNSRIYHSVGGQTRHQITADSAGQTACVVNTPADGGVKSQYLTASKAKSGNYTTFQIDIDQTSWGSFYMKVYISGYSGDSCHKWVAGYCNNGMAGIHTPLSNMTSSFSGGSATLTHISGQTWKYVIETSSGNHVTHPVMGVEFIFGGNGNMLDTGSISLSIS